MPLGPTGAVSQLGWRDGTSTDTRVRSGPAHPTRMRVRVCACACVGCAAGPLTSRCSGHSAATQPEGGRPINGQRSGQRPTQRSATNTMTWAGAAVYVCARVCVCPHRPQCPTAGSPRCPRRRPHRLGVGVVGTQQGVVGTQQGGAKRCVTLGLARNRGWARVLCVMHSIPRTSPTAPSLFLPLKAAETASPPLLKGARHPAPTQPIGVEAPCLTA